jgi:ABC-2 type transport system ATP-binding protein
VTAEAAIAVDGLAKRYGDRTVVEDVSFAVGAGEIVAILGPNGAGKTTTVEVIEGYRRADGGTVRVLGSDPWRAGREHRARVGLMLQGGGVAGGFDPRTTPREVARFYASLHEEAADPDEVLARVGIAADVARTRYRRLSGGERQRLALAVALVGRPEVLVLDEPTAGMDPEARASTRALIAEQARAGTAVLLTSHDLVDVERLADRIAILDRGRIAVTGSPAQLAGSGGAAIRFATATPMSDDDLAAIRGRLPGAAIARHEASGEYRLDGIEPDADAVAAVTAVLAERSVAVTSLRVGPASLEERYLEIVGQAASGDEASGGPEGTAA